MADRAANLRITVGGNVLVESATAKHRKNREVRNSCGVLEGTGQTGLPPMSAAKPLRPCAFAVDEILWIPHGCGQGPNGRVRV